MDVKRWTPYLIPLFKSGKIKSVGLSNHNIKEIKEAQKILDEAGIKISAIQNHFSILYRSSEFGGVLDYCKENNMEFFSYMVLEQGALSGKYNESNPLPKNSDRGNTYNPMLPAISKLTAKMTEIGNKYNITCAQMAISYALTKGTTPIIGCTKEMQVIEAKEALNVTLTDDEVNELENIASEANVDTRGSWEHRME